jgi:hypothetical protein
MKKILALTLILSLSSCAPMTPEQRQGWQDAWLRAQTVTTAVMPLALAAGAYADIENAQSLKRVSKK